MFMKSIKKVFARQLRRYETELEKIMWEILRNRRFLGFKFRRQHVVEGFVAVFYCHRLKFIVEIDGWVHDKRKHYDKIRDDILKSKGYSIIRFKNDEVVGNLSKVCQNLEYALTLTLSQGERESKPKALAKQ